MTIAKAYERYFGAVASIHLTVTKAMAEDLKSWPVVGEIVTLYDRPTPSFRGLTAKEKRSVLGRIQFPLPASESIEIELLSDDTPFNNPFVDSESVVVREKPFLLISSTSWTHDEDFSILLNALALYDNGMQQRSLVVLITGKGPLKAHYTSLYKKMAMKNVKIYTAWLPLEDYPLVLGCADIGVSLHTSSSGLDLPMKVVDLFSAYVPVLALDFQCIGELVNHGVNGVVFSSSEQLCKVLNQLTVDDDMKELAALRVGVKEFNEGDSWEKCWQEKLLPLLSEVAIT